MDQFRVLLSPEAGQWGATLCDEDGPLAHTKGETFAVARDNVVLLWNMCGEGQMVDPNIELACEIELPGVRKGLFDKVLAELRKHPLSSARLLRANGLSDLQIAAVLDVDPSEVEALASNPIRTGA